MSVPTKSFSPIGDVQAETAGLIAAAEPFATDTAEGAGRTMVHVDNGVIEAAEEKSLKEKGYLISVLPILDGDTVAGQAGSSVVDAGLAVRVAINPAFSPRKDALALSLAMKQALTSWRPSNPEGRYKLADKAFVVDDTDPGQLAYVWFFSKRCVL